MSRDEIIEHCIRAASQPYRGTSLADPTTKLWSDADQAKLDAAIAKHYRQMLQDQSMRSYREIEERRK